MVVEVSSDGVSSLQRVDSEGKVMALKNAIERNKVLNDIWKEAFFVHTNTKEGKRLEWHIKRRWKKPIAELHELLNQLRIEKAFQQAEGNSHG